MDSFAYLVALKKKRFVLEGLKEKQHDQAKSVERSKLNTKK